MRSHSGFTDHSEPAVQWLLSMSSALRNFHDVKGSFHYSVVPASELELKAHMCISRLCSATWLRRPLCNTWTIRNHRKIDNAFG